MNLSSTAQSFINWLSKQSVARLFAYTRAMEVLLATKEAEKQIVWHMYETEKASWNLERNALLDRLLEKQGLPSAFDTIKREPSPPPNPYAGLPPRQRAIAAAQAKELEAMRRSNGNS